MSLTTGTAELEMLQKEEESSGIPQLGILMILSNMLSKV